MNGALMYFSMSAGSGRRCSQSRSPVVASNAWMMSRGIREVQDAVVNERRAFLGAGLEPARPDELQLVDVAAIDLLQRAVAPRVERTPPHQPVLGRRIREHRVRHRRDARSICWARAGSSAAAASIKSVIASARPPRTGKASGMNVPPESLLVNLPEAEGYRPDDTITP